MTRRDHCAHCRRRTRERRQTLADHPGTVLYTGRGLCSTCHTAAARNGTLPPLLADQRTDPTPAETLRHTMDLLAWLTARRRRTGGHLHIRHQEMTI